MDHISFIETAIIKSTVQKERKSFVSNYLLEWPSISTATMKIYLFITQARFNNFRSMLFDEI